MVAAVRSRVADWRVPTSDARYRVVTRPRNGTFFRIEGFMAGG